MAFGDSWYLHISPHCTNPGESTRSTLKPRHTSTTATSQRHCCCHCHAAAEHRTARAIDWQLQSRTARAMIARCATWSWIRPHAVSWTRMRRRSGRRRRCARATARLTRTGRYQSCPWWSWHVIPRALCIAWSLRHPAASPPNQFFEAWNCVNLQASHRPEYLSRVLKSIHDASKNSNHRRPCVFVLDLQTKNPANPGGIGNAAEKGSRGIHYDAQQVRCS